MLVALRFPAQLVQWIMTCVTTPSFSIFVNCGLHGFFPAKKGLRQGDPMSPLLFAICMKYMSRLMDFLGKQPDFQFHHRCKALMLNHFAFADDLIMFCHGDVRSVSSMLRCLATFAETSRLVANNGKSAIYSSNMGDDTLHQVIEVSGFACEDLPFRYLGVIINAKKLSHDDCLFLLIKLLLDLGLGGLNTFLMLVELF